MSEPNGPQWGQPGGPQDPRWAGNQPPADQWGQPQQGQPQQGQPGHGPADQWNQPQPGQWNQPTGAQPSPQWGQPGAQQPGAQQPWGQQPGAQQPWGQQPQGQPGQPWGQPTGAQPTQQWGQPAEGQPGQQWAPQYGQPGGPGSTAYGEPPKKGTNKGVLITAIAVVVALVAGLGVWFFAFRDSKSGGQETAEQAAAQLFADIDNGDLVGLADTFDPVEAQFVNDFAGDVIEQFKRLGLLTDDATVNNSTGASISIKGITFDDAAAEKPLDDLTIVKLTGGTITVTPQSTTENQTDLFKQLIAATQKYADGQGMSADMTDQPTTIDIAKVIADENDGQPIRISTMLRDGSWYPSLFYTAADYWSQEAGLGAVTAADAIGGSGADSAEAAVTGMIDAILKQSATDVIGLLPPDEMAAVHTYGQKIVGEIGSGTPTSDVTYDAQWNTSDVTGGTLVSLKSLDFTADGTSGSIALDQDAGTITITSDGDTQTIDADSIGELIGTDLSEIHANLPDFVSRMLKAAMGVGIVTTQVDGKWYVSPLRTSTGVFTTLLGGMEQSDIQMFIDLANK